MAGPGMTSAALVSIGELSASSGIPQHVLRYWERRIERLQPIKRAGGRRYYRAEDVALVTAIRDLMANQGYTLDGAARAFAGDQRRAQQPSVEASAAAAVPASSFVAQPARAAVDVARLQALRNRLAAALG